MSAADNERTSAQAQFAPVAQAYVTSHTHAQGADLARLVELAALQGHETVLDVATGGGHAALALAPHAAQVIACDLTVEMLHAARTHIIKQGVANVWFHRTLAEQLAFAEASFDLVVCRVAAHHFTDIAAFVHEAARVLRPGGRLLVGDHIGIDDSSLDAFMDRFERWRDPSHVRAYTFAEWRTFCRAAGLTPTLSQPFPWLPYEFESWTERIRMPADERDALEAWLLAAAPRFRKAFAIVAHEGRIVSLQGRFGVLMAQKP